MIAIIGGGAAGVFAAIQAAQSSARVVLLEAGSQLLTKVRISGGGRCNVTHSCFEPKSLTQAYPRGEKELLGPFTRFQPQDMIRWLEERGVPLKTEEDGRIFPQSDSSETIIQVFLKELASLGVEVRFKSSVRKIEKTGESFLLTLEEGSLQASKVLLATGSARQGYALAESLGHTIVNPVPSLFTFNIPSSPLLDLAGISVNPVRVSLKDTPFAYTGPLLLTHWGFSGPAILKLSAWGARFLAERGYRAGLLVDWSGGTGLQDIYEKLAARKEESPSQALGSQSPFPLPKNLWKTLLFTAGVEAEKSLARFSKKELLQVAEKLTRDVYLIEGKTTYKEEFVTCGGVSLKEIHFQRMESKLCPGLFFAGEVLNIDGITGGFNFQNAWTTAYLAAGSMERENQR